MFQVRAVNLHSSSTAGLTACAWCRVSMCGLEAQPFWGAKPTAQAQNDCFSYRQRISCVTSFGIYCLTKLGNGIEEEISIRTSGRPVCPLIALHLHGPQQYFVISNSH